MKISTKIAVGFGINIVLIAGLGLFSMHGTREIQGAAELASTKYWPQRLQILEIRNRFQQTGADYFALMGAKDPTQQAKLRSKIRAELVKNHKAMHDFSSLLTSNDELTLWNSLHDARAQLFARAYDILEVQKQRGAALPELQKLQPLVMKNWDALGKINELAQTQLQEGIQVEQDLYRRSARVAWIITLFAALLTAVGLAWIARSLKRSLRGAIDVAEQVAACDLRVEQQAISQDEFGSLQRALQAMTQRLRAALTEVHQGSHAMSAAAREVSSSSQTLAGAASVQASSVEQTSATLEQAQSAIRKTAESARATAIISRQVVEQAREGGQAVQRTVTDMKAIAQRISLVDDIAYRTNMLALNAAIEAARAGQHGKGFAVVAAEVRRLAEHSQVAAKEIGELAGNAVQQAERAGEILGATVPAILRTSTLIAEVDTSSDQLAVGVQQITLAVGQINSAMQQNAAAAEQLAATSEEMNAQAQQLEGHLARFQI